MSRKLENWSQSNAAPALPVCLGPPALLLTERGARARLGSGRPMGGQAGRGEGERGPRVAESRDHGAGSIAKRTMNCF